MLRLFARIAGGLLVAMLLVYLADFTVWRIRLAHGSGMDTVQVTRVSVATLKAGKEEYYFEGSDMQTCTRSVLPPLIAEGFQPPCWWLARHPQSETRY